MQSADAIGAHQPERRHRLQKVLSHQRIDGGYARDIDDGDFRFGLDDFLKERLHHHLRARGIQRTDHGERQNAVPQFDHGGR